MTVEQLIRELEKFDKSTVVVSDGPDIGGYDVEAGLNISLTLVDLQGFEKIPDGRYLRLIHSHDAGDHK
jgi:hypothetical protein